jgi:LAO/AO transport system kinase
VLELTRRILDGEVRATARVCRMVDDRVEGHREILKELYPGTGSAWVLGITGNPGAGKSTLTDRLIQRFRLGGTRVGVVAVDPTSPFTGGAILGDRIRMQQHFEDPEVFIRSVATRGALGGLSRSAADIARVLDAWGAGVVIVETVGVGQDELEVTRAAHTTLVVMAPGMGDDVQAIKAGILECADVFAVNKADREGVQATVRDLELMIALGSNLLGGASTAGKRGHSAAAVRVPKPTGAQGEPVEGPWTPPIVECIATRDHGTGELRERLEAHRAWLGGTDAGRARRIERQKEQMVASLRDTLVQEAAAELGQAIDEAARRVEAREIDPYSAADELIAQFRAR